jgi:hypothetical protein
MNDFSEDEDQYATPLKLGKKGSKKSKRVTFADDPYSTPLRESMVPDKTLTPATKGNSKAWITALALLVIVCILGYLGYKWFVLSANTTPEAPLMISTPVLPQSATNQSFAFGTPNVLSGLQDFKDLELL